MKKNFPLFSKIHTQLIFRKSFLFTVAILAAVSRIIAQNTDITPPQINEFNLSSSVIETTDTAQNVAINVRVTDNDKGVKLVAVRFQSASGNQFVNAFINSQQRISGDSRDGVYRATVAFPQYSKAGTWSIFEMETRDEANNYKVLNTAEIASFGFATELQVISNNEDVTAPEVTDLSFNSSTIDTTNSSQTVSVSVRAADAFSGVRKVNVYFYLPSNDYLVGTELNNQQLVSGDGKDGIYNGILTFPQGTDAGTWRIAVSVSDAIGNFQTVDTSALAARGFATQLQVMGRTSASATPKTRKRARFF